ncbi:MAG: hypothetical protein ACFCU3_12290 [Verrucomicrobiales bacterium]
MVDPYLQAPRRSLKGLAGVLSFFLLSFVTPGAAIPPEQDDRMWLNAVVQSERISEAASLLRAALELHPSSHISEILSRLEQNDLHAVRSLISTFPELDPQVPDVFELRPMLQAELKALLEGESIQTVERGRIFNFSVATQNADLQGILDQAFQDVLERLNDQSATFNGFWTSEHRAAELNHSFPDSIREGWASHHQENVIRFQKVTLRGFYGVRHPYPQEVQRSDNEGLNIQAMVADSKVVFDLKPTLLENDQVEVIRFHQIIGEPRPLEDQHLLRSAFEAAQAEGSGQAPSPSFNEILGEIKARDISVTEFRKAPVQPETISRLTDISVLARSE